MCKQQHWRAAAASPVACLLVTFWLPAQAAPATCTTFPPSLPPGIPAGAPGGGRTLRAHQRHRGAAAGGSQHGRRAQPAWHHPPARGLRRPPRACCCKPTLTQQHWPACTAGCRCTAPPLLAQPPLPPCCWRRRRTRRQPRAGAALLLRCAWSTCTGTARLASTRRWRAASCQPPLPTAPCRRCERRGQRCSICLPTTFQLCRR